MVLIGRKDCPSLIWRTYALARSIIVYKLYKGLIGYRWKQINRDLFVVQALLEQERDQEILRMLIIGGLSIDTLCEYLLLQIE